MSHAVIRAAQPCTSSPPATAPIFHYACLYTHDLRRKQKRWQDGEVKFHTFNKRYMVYDDRGSFIGDGHWQGDVSDFGEGLELELDRGAAIVQVDRCTGSTDQDLTDLLDKRAKEVEKRRASAAARSPAPGNHSTRPDQTPRQHRALNELMPNRGPIGRAAIPNQSPYEVRRNVLLAEQDTNRRPAPPPAKERREQGSPPSKMGHAQSLFGTKLTLTAGTQPRKKLRAKTLHLDINLQQKRPKHKTQVEEESEEDQMNASSEPLLPGRVKIARSHAIMAKQLAVSSRVEAQRKERDLSPSPCASEVTQEIIGHAPAQQRQTRQHEEEESGDSEKEHHGKYGEGEFQNTVLSESSPEPETKSRERPQRPKLSSISRETQRDRENRERYSAMESETNAITMSESKGPRCANRSLHAKTKQGSTKSSHNATPALENNDNKRTQSKKPTPSKGKTPCKEKKAKKKTADGEDQQAEKRSRSAETNTLTVTPFQDNEKRTQLRSKSRPRRGLLILSELSEKKPPGTENSEKPSQEIPETNCGRKSKTISRHEKIMGISSDESEDFSTPPKTTASKIKKRRKEKSEESDDSGPRITKMARKSVKSKEIIGFAVPINDPIPAPFLSMMNPLVIKPRDGVETSEAHKPRIANPATRGKKAARKEDAAGQVPRSIVPFEPVLPEPAVAEPGTTARTDVGETHPGSKQSSKSELNRNVNSSKGILMQNMGPWSRHAEDLLGMARPVGKVERR